MKGLRIVGKAKGLRTSTVLDHKILELIKLSMSENGYGQRQRSKWISESISQLEECMSGCDNDERLETLSRASTLSENGGHITIVLNPESVAFLDKCKLFMADREAGFEINAQSRMIHFAITFRLIREKYL